MPLAARQDLSNFGFKQFSGSTLTLTGTTNFLGTLKSKGIEINASPSASGFTTGGTVLVLTLLGNEIKLAPSVGSSGGTNICFNTNRYTTRTVIPSVCVGGACTITNFLEGYFFPAVPPSSSLSIGTGSALRQFGDCSFNCVAGGLAWSVTKNTNPFTGNICFATGTTGSFNGVIAAIGGSQGGAVKYSLNSSYVIPSTACTSTIQTFKICAITTASEVTCFITTITWENKRFWFKSNTSYITGSDAAIQAILNAGSVIGSELCDTRVKTFLPITFSNEYFYYVYPKNLGVPSFIVNALPNNAWGNLGTGTLFIINYTNTNGYASPFYVAKSDQRLNTTFNIQAS